MVFFSKDMYFSSGSKFHTWTEPRNPVLDLDLFQKIYIIWFQYLTRSNSEKGNHYSVPNPGSDQTIKAKYPKPNNIGVNLHITCFFEEQHELSAKQIIITKLTYSVWTDREKFVSSHTQVWESDYVCAFSCRFKQLAIIPYRPTFLFGLSIIDGWLIVNHVSWLLVAKLQKWFVVAGWL
jgi:hypothetical protein